MKMGTRLTISFPDPVLRCTLRKTSLGAMWGSDADGGHWVQLETIQMGTRLQQSQARGSVSCRKAHGAESGVPTKLSRLHTPVSHIVVIIIIPFYIQGEFDPLA